MKKIINVLISTAFVIAIMLVSSCRKSDTPTSSSLISQMLTSKTWQQEEVTGYNEDGSANTIYKRGAADNEEDYSQVRQTFKADGSIVYTDQEGNSGTNGVWELLDNDTKLRLSLPSLGLSIIVEDVMIFENLFSYKLKAENQVVAEYKFTPIK